MSTEEEQELLKWYNDRCQLRDEQVEDVKVEHGESEFQVKGCLRSTKLKCWQQRNYPMGSERLRMECWSDMWRCRRLSPRSGLSFFPKDRRRSICLENDGHFYRCTLVFWEVTEGRRRL